MTVVDDAVRDFGVRDVGTEDVVPLTVDFDVVLRGYDRYQVQRHLNAVDDELKLLTIDRDAAVRRAEDLARQVERQRREIADLRSRMDRICRTPVDPAGLTERLRRMVELARDEAAEITSSARAAARQSWHSTQQATTRLRERCDRLAAELDTRRQQMEHEHRELLSQAQAEIKTLTDQAAERRRQLDERAAAQRRLADGDFRIAMAARRKETLAELAAMRASAQAEADRMIAEAQRRVDALVALRQRIADRLLAAQELLDRSGRLLEPLPDDAGVAAPRTG